MKEHRLDEFDWSIIEVFEKAAQLRMYRHFEAQLKKNGSISYEQYTEQIKPQVELLQGIVDQKIDGLAPYIRERL